MRLLLRALALPLCLLALASAGSLLASCSGSPPSINRLEWNLVTRPAADSGTSAESLSLFVMANDPDGNVEIEKLDIVNDDAALVWKLDADSWTRREESGNLWIGSNGLALPDAKGVPAGEYRVILLDSGGNSAEQNFVVPPHSPASIIAASLSGGVLTASPPWTDATAVLLDGAGQTVAAAPFSSGSHDLTTLFGGNAGMIPRARDLYLISLDRANHKAVYSCLLRLP